MEETVITGQVFQLNEIDEYIKKLVEKWDEETAELKTSFWKFWETRVNLKKVTNFLLLSLDGLINLVDDLIESGPDKKATVLNAVDMLYEYVAREAIPIWLRPFAGRVKHYIIHTLVSESIDWIVEKYREGSWKGDAKPQEA